MDPETMSPAAGGTDGRARMAQQDSEHSNTTTGGRARKPALAVRLLPDGVAFVVKGRCAQTLRLLVVRGGQGFTADEVRSLDWGCRLSQYLFALRRRGVRISTTRERGPDGALIGRHTLLSRVEVANDT